MAKKIGITMRIDTAAGHGERRDSLALDWASFMSALCPSVSWMPLPNLGEGIVDYVQQWNLDAIIFSGGNDLGTEQQRDITETTLLDFALRHGLKVFGVCRGLQLLQQHAGGSLERCQREIHVGRSHPVHLRADLLEFDTPGQVTVNSYHNWAVPMATLAPSLELLAVSEDGCVEAVRHRTEPITAVQWHPERKANATQIKLDRQLMSQALELDL
jgi:gamma-glutamyl-gamma-aminobutyrate hydrolase PuuD